MMGERREGVELLEDENVDPSEIGRVDDVLHCDCRFYRKYQLPCRHIWAQHELFGVIRWEDEDRWVHMWDESGFEIYERMETCYIESAIDDDIGAPERSRLTMRDTLESLQNRYYELSERAAKVLPEHRDRLLNWWTTRLNELSGDMWRLGIDQFCEAEQITVPVRETPRFEWPEQIPPLSSACWPAGDSVS